MELETEVRSHFWGPRSEPRIPLCRQALESVLCRWGSSWFSGLRWNRHRPAQLWPWGRAGGTEEVTQNLTRPPLGLPGPHGPWGPSRLGKPPSTPGLPNGQEYAERANSARRSAQQSLATLCHETPEDAQLRFGGCRLGTHWRGSGEKLSKQACLMHQHSTAKMQDLRASLAPQILT